MSQSRPPKPSQEEVDTARRELPQMSIFSRPSDIVIPRLAEIQQRETRFSRNIQAADLQDNFMVALHRYVNDIPGLFKYWIGWFAKMERLDLIQEFWNFKPGGWDIRYREENGAMVVEVQRPYTNWEIYGSFPKADDLGFMAPESD